MTPRKILLLTVAVVVLFGFIFLFERKMPTTTEAQQKRISSGSCPRTRSR